MNNCAGSSASRPGPASWARSLTLGRLDAPDARHRRCPDHVITETALGSLEALIARAPARRCLLSVTVEVEVDRSRARPCSPRGWPATAGSAGSSPTATASRWRRWVDATRRCRAGRRASPIWPPSCAGLSAGGSPTEPDELPAGRGAGLGRRLRLRRPMASRRAALVVVPARARWCCPELALLRAGGRTWLTLSGVLGPGPEPQRPGRARAPARLADRATAADARPEPAGGEPDRQRRRPRAYEDAVAAGVGADPRRRARQGRPRPRGRGRGSGGARPRRHLRRPARAVPVLLLLLRRLSRGRLPRRQPGAAGPPPRRRGRDRRARRLDPAQRRPGGRRPPRRAAAALGQGPARAPDRRPPDRAQARAALGLGRGRRTSPW